MATGARHIFHPLPNINKVFPDGYYAKIRFKKSQRFAKYLEVIEEFEPDGVYEEIILDFGKEDEDIMITRSDDAHTYVKSITRCWELAKLEVPKMELVVFSIDGNELGIYDI